MKGGFSRKRKLGKALSGGLLGQLLGEAGNTISDADRARLQAMARQDSGKSISDADRARIQEFLGSMTSPRRKTDRQLMQFEKGGKVKKPKTLNKGGGLNAAINRVKKEQGMKKGGAAFPDLTGDGKVTQKDILKGRGVDLKQEGGAVRGMGRAYMGAPRKVKIR